MFAQENVGLAFKVAVGQTNAAAAAKLNLIKFKTFAKKLESGAKQLKYRGRKSLQRSTIRKILQLELGFDQRLQNELQTGSRVANRVGSGCSTVARHTQAEQKS